MFAMKRPDPKKAMKELKTNAAAFAAMVAVIRLVPYVLHGLQRASS